MGIKHKPHGPSGETAHSHVSRGYQTFHRDAEQIMTFLRRRQRHFLSKTRAAGSCSLRKQWYGVETQGSMEKWLRFSTLNCLIFASVSRLAGRSVLVMLLPVASVRAGSAAPQSTPSTAQGPFLGKSAVLIKHSAIMELGCSYLWQLNEYLDDFLLN